MKNVKRTRAKQNEDKMDKSGNEDIEVEQLCIIHIIQCLLFIIELDGFITGG